MDGGGSGGEKWKGEGAMATVNKAMLPLKHKLLGAPLPENLGFTVAKVFWRDGKGEGKSQEFETLLYYLAPVNSPPLLPMVCSLERVHSCSELCM